MLELLDQKCKTSVINMLRALMEKQKKKNQEQMVNASITLKTFKKNQKVMLKIKNNVREINK